MQPTERNLMMVAKQARWGILSTANIAAKVGRAIKLANGATLVAVASRTTERAKSWATQHGVGRAYGSYQALLKDPEIDAVYIPLPPSMHAEWTIKAAEHGKHVLCEKPLAVNLAEATAMAAACQRNGVQLMDGVMWAHHERTEKMKQIIDSGELGQLRRTTAAFTFNWDTVPQNNIRVRPELGGGSLGDLGYYCVRALLWSLGELPLQVYATARYENGVDFNLAALLWFSEGRVASFDCGFDAALRKWFEVAGTQASLICDDFTVPWKEETARFWVHNAQGKAAEHRVDNCIQEVRMIECFSRIVQTGKLEPQWITDAVNTMRVCDALLRSAKERRVVDLNP